MDRFLSKSLLLSSLEDASDGEDFVQQSHSADDDSSDLSTRIAFSVNLSCNRLGR